PNIEYKMQKSDYSQLLQNLMSNAIKYNKKNGKVSINLTRSDKDIILEVSDTGIGIEKDKIKYIFERFYRCDTSRSKEVQGNGLGLSIVKELISNMGATVEVESELNRGTKFKICFKEK
ncbi:MAG: sensor histidine kinase, partial [Leptotrichiaceae bacterium]